MMEKKFVDLPGLEYFAERINELIEQAKQINTVTDIDETSTDQQIPSAKAVFDFVIAMMSGVSKLHQVVVDVLPDAGETNTIYLKKADEDTYTQYIYSEGQWYDLGSTEIDLSGYWKKEDLVALTNEEIQDVIDDVTGA
jgi:hypothetical protein